MVQPPDGPFSPTGSPDPHPCGLLVPSHSACWSPPIPDLAMPWFDPPASPIGPTLLWPTAAGWHPKDQPWTCPQTWLRPMRQAAHFHSFLQRPEKAWWHPRSPWEAQLGSLLASSHHFTRHSSRCNSWWFDEALRQDLLVEVDQGRVCRWGPDGPPLWVMEYLTREVARGPLWSATAAILHRPLGVALFVYQGTTPADLREYFATIWSALLPLAVDAGQVCGSRASWAPKPTTSPTGSKHMAVGSSSGDCMSARIKAGNDPTGVLRCTITEAYYAASRPRTPEHQAFRPGFSHKSLPSSTIEDGEDTSRNVWDIQIKRIPSTAECNACTSIPLVFLTSWHALAAALGRSHGDHF